MNSLVRKWGEQVIRSRQYASAVALIMAFLSFFNMPIVGWISTIIIGLVTLQNGPRQGLIVSAWAILPAVAMLYLGQYTLSVGICLLHYLVMWCFAVVLRQTHSWIKVLSLATFIGIIMVLAAYWLVPGLQSVVVSQLTAIMKEYKPILLFNLQPKDIALAIQYLSLVASGCIALAFILTNLITLFLARWWQSSVSPMINVQKECASIRLHYLASLSLIVFILGWMINTSLWINLLVVMLIPFIISGLSLSHSYIGSKKHGFTLLFLFYLAFIVLPHYMMMLLSLLGWLDSFINFRRRVTIQESAL